MEPIEMGGGGGDNASSSRVSLTDKTASRSSRSRSRSRGEDEGMSGGDDSSVAADGTAAGGKLRAGSSPGGRRPRHDRERDPRERDAGEVDRDRDPGGRNKRRRGGDGREQRHMRQRRRRSSSPSRSPPAAPYPQPPGAGAPPPCVGRGRGRSSSPDGGGGRSVGGRRRGDRRYRGGRGRRGGPSRSPAVSPVARAGGAGGWRSRRGARGDAAGVGVGGGGGRRGSPSARERRRRGRRGDRGRSASPPPFGSSSSPLSYGRRRRSRSRGDAGGPRYERSSSMRRRGIDSVGRSRGHYPPRRDYGGRRGSYSEEDRVAHDGGAGGSALRSRRRRGGVAEDVFGDGYGARRSPASRPRYGRPRRDASRTRPRAGRRGRRRTARRRASSDASSSAPPPSRSVSPALSRRVRRRDRSLPRPEEFPSPGRNRGRRRRRGGSERRSGRGWPRRRSSRSRGRGRGRGRGESSSSYLSSSSSSRDGRHRRRRRRRQPREDEDSDEARYRERDDHRHRREAVAVSEEDERPASGGGGSSGDDDRDDEVGHYRGPPGSIVADRYEIVRDVGMGTFGRVVECFDLRSGKRTRRRSSSDRRGGGDAASAPSSSRTATVAIKVVRDVRRYHESALIEADIVQDVNSRGGRGRSLCAQMLDRFDFRGHYCLVFECLGRSLYDFLKRHDFVPFPLYCVRDFAGQLLDALDFLHGFGLIHTDLKPENILLVSNAEATYRGGPGEKSRRVPASTKIKVIDFGGATYDYERKSSIINTRQYRAPEVILGLGWGAPSDLWSAGCILSELYTGDLLFATHDNAEHLALMERCVGPFPRDVLDRSSLAREVFDEVGGGSHSHHSRSSATVRHRTHILSDASRMHVRGMAPLERIVRDPDRSSGLTHLLQGLLTIDPNYRLTAGSSLESRFFRSGAV